MTRRRWRPKAAMWRSSALLPRALRYLRPSKRSVFVGIAFAAHQRAGEITSGGTHRAGASMIGIKPPGFESQPVRRASADHALAVRG